MEGFISSSLILLFQTTSEIYNLPYQLNSNKIVLEVKKKTNFFQMWCSYSINTLVLWSYDRFRWVSKKDYKVAHNYDNGDVYYEIELWTISEDSKEVDFYVKGMGERKLSLLLWCKKKKKSAIYYNRNYFRNISFNILNHTNKIICKQHVEKP